MSRCSARKGAGDTLACCRLDHPEATEDGHHCWHFAVRLRGTPGPHTFWTRASAGHPMVCTAGQALDVT